MILDKQEKHDLLVLVQQEIDTDTYCGPYFARLFVLKEKLTPKPAKT